MTIDNTTTECDEILIWTFLIARQKSAHYTAFQADPCISIGSTLSIIYLFLAVDLFEVETYDTPENGGRWPIKIFICCHANMILKLRTVELRESQSSYCQARQSCLSCAETRDKGSVTEASSGCLLSLSLMLEIFMHKFSDADVSKQEALTVFHAVSSWTLTQLSGQSYTCSITHTASSGIGVDLANCARSSPCVHYPLDLRGRRLLEQVALIIGHHKN